MSEVTANELKTRGIASVRDALRNSPEATISVRGRPRYVVMDVSHFERLREAEIFPAWQAATVAESEGDYVSESAEAHIERLKRELDADDV